MAKKAEKNEPEEGPAVEIVGAAEKTIAPAPLAPKPEEALPAVPVAAPPAPAPPLAPRPPKVAPAPPRAPEKTVTVHVDGILDAKTHRHYQCGSQPITPYLQALADSGQRHHGVQIVTRDAE